MLAIFVHLNPNDYVVKHADTLSTEKMHRILLIIFGRNHQLYEWKSNIMTAQRTCLNL